MRAEMLYKEQQQNACGAGKWWGKNSTSTFGRHYQQRHHRHHRQQQPLLSSSSQLSTRTVRNPRHQCEIELSSYRPPSQPTPITIEATPATATATATTGQATQKQKQLIELNDTDDTELSTHLSPSSLSNNTADHHTNHNNHNLEDPYEPFYGNVPAFQQQQQKKNELLMTTKDSHTSNTRNINNDVNPSKDLSSQICSHGFCCIQCVRTQEVGIVENCGAFEQIVGPGLYLGFCWPFNGITSRLSLRIQQLDMTIESKSKDDVFLSMSIAVQYRVILQYAYDAYYGLKDTKRQIQTYLFDVVRSILPKIDIDEIFVSQRKISDVVFCRLQSIMKYYGYEVVSILIGSIRPNELVQYAMNEMNVSKRIKEAIPHQADAERISKVKRAEAIAEKMYLWGIGIAKKRAAIAQGLKESMMTIRRNDKTTNKELQQDAVDMLLLTQYFDTLVAIGADEMVVHNNIMGIPQNFIMERTE